MAMAAGSDCWNRSSPRPAPMRGANPSRPSPSFQGLRVPGKAPPGRMNPGHYGAPGPTNASPYYGAPAPFPGAHPPLFSPYNIPPKQVFDDARETVRNKPQPPDLNRTSGLGYAKPEYTHFVPPQAASKLRPHWNNDGNLSSRGGISEEDAHSKYVSRRETNHGRAPARRTGSPVGPIRDAYHDYVEGRVGTGHCKTGGNSRHLC